MKESTLIKIISGAFILLAIAYIAMQPVFDFSFSSATLNVDGKSVSESLTYTPKLSSYHTLYRNFLTPIGSSSYGDYIMMGPVQCSAGTPYVNENLASQLAPYTERNEYGCTFGPQRGFESMQTYNLSAQYTLMPKTLTRYEGKYYIKFVAYSPDQHPLLIKGFNFNVDAPSSGLIMPNQPVIVYIPFTPDNLQDYQTINVSMLDYENGSMWVLVLLILPAFLFYAIWLIFGRENKEGDYPPELSLPPPVKRKAWEVAIYFHPPFGELDQNFLPAMIMDFYNRKYIDVQTRKEGLIIKTDEIYIKILRTEGLDDVEKKVMAFFEEIGNIEKGTDGYFSIKKNSNSFMGRMKIPSSYRELRKEMKKQSREFMDYTGSLLVYITFFLWFIISGWMVGISIFYAFAILITVSITTKKTSLFHKFKGDHYLEYQQWQGFNKYLSTLDSIKRSPPKGIIMWEQYLVYATAMGSGKNVLKAMRDMKVIDERTYGMYTCFYIPAAFGTAGAAASGGGGMGGGGIGGGGGGGR